MVHSAKRPKTTAMASPSVPAIHCLPPELLETIVGFLDVGTLCTARLTCIHFRLLASRCIHSVEISVETLRTRPDTTLTNFPNLNRVSILDVKGGDLLMLAQSPIADAITHLRAVEYLRKLPQKGRIAASLPVPPLPNLRSLTVGYAPNFLSQTAQTLRELRLGYCATQRTANLVAGLTNLTCLRIDVRNMCGPFEAVTALTALQRLEIRGPLEIIPLVSDLTLLTHLQFQANWISPSPMPLVLTASLTRLHRLVHLGFSCGGTDLELETAILAGIATFTSLKSLDLGICERPERSALETVCVAPFSQLTALRLGSRGLDASFLPRFNLERLQGLSLSFGVQLDGVGVAALRRATGLTHLQLWTVTGGTSVRPEEWEVALSRLSRLRALSVGTPDKSLGTPGAVHAPFSLKAIALLTELTRLDLSGRGVTSNADLEVCLGLKNLRVLRMLVPNSTPEPSCRITPETLFAIAQLPELRKFSVLGNIGILERDLTNDVWARINAERHDRGWPPLDLRIGGPP